MREKNEKREKVRNKINIETYINGDKREEGNEAVMRMKKRK